MKTDHHERPGLGEEGEGSPEQNPARDPQGLPVMDKLSSAGPCPGGPTFVTAAFLLFYSFSHRTCHV